MGLIPRIAITDSQLLVHGKALLSSVPKNVALTPATGFASSSAFLGVSSSESKSRHVFSLGVLRDLRFVCCFRFKLWWMTQRMGNCGKDVPLETQFLLMESKHDSILSPESDVAEEMVYTVFLPILEGPFRSSLQGNETDELELCLESGDSAVCTSSGLYSIYLHAGTNPFEVIAEAVKEVEMNLKTFQHREKKKLPGILDWFGWCTWDAFYRDVTAQGVMEGLKSLESGGTPVRFIIIDDGWQSVGGDDQPQIDIEPGTEAPMRLINIKENYKFQKDGKDGERHDDPALGIQHVISEAKKIHNLKYVYVWHALTGYWGGVKPGVIGMEDYESTMKFPIPSPGVLGNSPDMETDHLVTFGHGLVHPKRVFEFYNELHSYLAASGVDGVKVDVQNIIETLGSGFGGRVSLTRQYLEALEASIASKFPENGCIACMSHNTDGLYNLKQIAVLRASDDFWPADPSSHTIHIASVAYNSLFLGEFMQPDWDMFHSLHPAAEYHAAARAIGGGPVYVSDKPGHHDFELLKKLVLPDGSVLRACLPGRPTRDSLFNDPARDGKSLLKIWNMNKHTGVLGIFNCQGAGWCELRKVNAVHNSSPPTITGVICASDVALLTQIAPPQGWTHECILYSHRGGELRKLLESTILPITLQPMEYEVFTVVPVKMLAPGVSFAPLGLLKMFNAGGAITDLCYGMDDKPQGTPSPSVSVVNITITVHGCGQFGAYSSSRPSKCFVGSSPIDFSYNPANGLVSLSLPISDDLYQKISFQIKI